MTRPKIKFTVADYMTAPEDRRYQLLDGEMIVAPSPTTRHQTICIKLATELFQFVSQNDLGQVFSAPYDVVLSNHDVAQPDILFVSNRRSHIVTAANIQGAPDLIVEVLSPGTQQYDRGYKRTLYARHGVREYWLVDPDAETVEVLVEGGDAGLTPAAAYGRADTLVSPLLPGLSLNLSRVFSRK
jgi:Uma2 family endonuclease